MVAGDTLMDLIISLGSVSMTSVLIFVLYRICKTKSNCRTNVGGFSITVSNTSSPIESVPTTTATHTDEPKFINVRERHTRTSVTDTNTSHTVHPIVVDGVITPIEN
jgi:hypothetical protein